MANEILERMKSQSSPPEEQLPLCAVAISTQAVTTLKKGAPGEHLTFVLDVIGEPNANGQIVPADEALAAATTAIGRQVKLSDERILKDSDLHARKMSAKVGKILEASVKGNLIVCQGRVYGETDNQKLARQMLADGDLGWVSRENGFREGECSTCHHKFTHPSKICKHLAVDKATNTVVGTKHGSVIMRGVRYSAVALLDKPGAFPGSRILEVAATKAEGNMGENATNTEMEAAASKIGDATNALTEAQAKIKELETENAALKSANEAFQAKEKKAAAEALVATMEAKGVAFADAKAKQSKVDELTAMNEAEFGAHKSAWDAIPSPTAAAPAETTTTETTPPAPPAKTPLSAAATKTTTGTPADVSDRKNTDDTREIARRHARILARAV